MESVGCPGQDVQRVLNKQIQNEETDPIFLQMMPYSMILLSVFLRNVLAKGAVFPLGMVGTCTLKELE